MDMVICNQRNEKCEDTGCTHLKPHDKYSRCKIDHCLFATGKVECEEYNAAPSAVKGE